MATANLFRQGHRICLEITSLDLPTGVAGATNAEYVPYHICSSKTVLHQVFHDRAHPSHCCCRLFRTEPAATRARLNERFMARFRGLIRPGWPLKKASVQVISR